LRRVIAPMVITSRPSVRMDAARVASGDRVNMPKVRIRASTIRVAPRVSPMIA